MKNLLIICLLLFSCCLADRKNKETPLSEFGEIEEKISVSTSIGNQMNRAFEMMLIDSLLIVSDPDRGFHFKVFDIKSEILVDQFGIIGDGPCEVQFPAALQRLVGKDKIIGINNRKKFAYSEYPLLKNEFFSDSCLSFEGKYDFNYQKFVKFNDQQIVGTGLFSSRFAISDMSNQKVVSLFGNYPHQKDLPLYSHNILAMAYQGELVVHPVNPWIVSTSRTSFNFDIVKFDEQANLEELIEKHYWAPEFEGSDQGGMISATMKNSNRNGSLSVSVTKDHIYILFSGKTDKNGGNQGNQVLVYDWSGNPLRILNLDQHLELIAVDEAETFIIGYVDDGNPNIYKFIL
jgi:hypothetical protein